MMNLDRRHFLLASSAACVPMRWMESLAVAASAVAEANMHWPTPQALFDGLLRPLDAPLPPPERIFGDDPKALIEAGTTAPPGEMDISGRYFAAFLKAGGPNKARGAGRSLPMLKPTAHSSAEAVAFYTGLLSGDAMAVSRRGRTDCPWCGKRFGGLEMLTAPGFALRTVCCRQTTEGSKGEDLNFAEERSYARWRFLLVQLGGLIATTLDADGNPLAKPVLMAVVKALPAFLERQSWQCGSRKDGLARRGDFTEEALPESSKSLPADGFPTAEELDHLVRFFSEAEVESIPAAEDDKHPYRASFTRSDHALLAEAFGVVASDLDPKDRTQVMEALRRQFALVRHVPQPGGNFPGLTLPETLSIAIGSGDHALYQQLLEFSRHYLHNHFYDDGMSVEGAFNYAVMVSTFYRAGFRDRWGGTVWKQWVKQRPILARLDEIGCYPIRTLHGVESQHSDEHVEFFRSAMLESVSEPKGELAGTNPCFPSYGIGCLRAGPPGGRLEGIMDFRSGVLHTHAARLNVQLFFEGVSLMPDLGYAASSTLADPAEVPAQIREQQPLTVMRPWFTNALEMHCAPTIDGHLGNSPHGLVQGWFAKDGREDPGAGLRFMEVNLPPENFEKFPGNIRRCERQWMMVSLPGGNAVAVSVCRLSGGRRHDLWWHFPAPPVEPCSRVEETADNLFDYLGKTVDTPPPFARELEDRKGTFALIAKKRSGEKSLTYGEDSRELRQVRVWKPKEQGVDRHRWYINPADYAIGIDRKTEPWLQNPVELTMWSARSGTPARNRCLGSRAPWPAMAQVDTYRRATVCRADALDVFTEQRHAIDDRPLESVFINVLSARPAGESEAGDVQSVRVLENDPSVPSSRLGAGVEWISADKVACTVMTTEGAEGIFRSSSAPTELRGRAGKICPETLEVVLVDGEFLRGHGFELTIAPGWDAPLAGLVGDLTGQPDASALLLKLPQALPSVLAGTLLSVDHAANPSHRSSFEIAAVSTTADGFQRIDLAGNPPFALANLVVTGREKNWVRVRENQRFAPNRPISHHRIAYFPTADFTALQVGASTAGSGAWFTTSIRFDRDLPATIRPGDPFILYSIQKGDRVRMPATFACRRVGETLAIESTGKAELVVPGVLKFATVPDGVKITTQGSATRLEIPAGVHSLRL